MSRTGGYILHRGRLIPVVACLSLAIEASVSGQEEGRIFNPTEEVVGIWEFNDLPVDILEPVPDGTIIPDLSGNDLDAVVVDNGGALVAQEGDPNFDENTGIERVGDAGAARVTVEDDGDEFEFDEEQDFTFELYVTRAEAVGGATWGILAGTLHTRTTINDGEDPNATGAWYGWGIFQRGGQPGWLLVVSPTSPDGTVGRLGCCPNEKRNDASWEITPGSHYVVATFDRSGDPQEARAYLDGELVERLSLQPDWAFLTPDGYEHANLTFLTGVDDLTRGAFRDPPTGYSIDAARVTRRAMDADEVLEHWLNIQDGVATPEQETVGATRRAGDVNGDGDYNVTDAVAQLEFQFSGRPLPDCYVVPGSTMLTEAGLAIVDFNGDGTPNLTDAIASLQFLFSGGAPPAVGVGCVEIPGSCENKCP